jgi:hypothetical protein
VQSPPPDLALPCSHFFKPRLSRTGLKGKKTVGEGSGAPVGAVTVRQARFAQIRVVWLSCSYGYRANYCLEPWVFSAP